MAKRRRLDLDPFSMELSAHPVRRETAAPPIADIAGDAARAAAEGDVVAAMQAARDEGRLVVRIPLDAIAGDHLVRDRIASGIGEEEMGALIASIRAHGQRTAIEVVERAPGRFGLISGWRRLSALRQLHRETGEARFAEALALVRRPAEAGAAYVAMVEENEIRVGLSHYERARVAVEAAKAGAFADVEAAVDTLFAAGSKARRSKIRSFVAIHEALGEVLRFPCDLPERLGLRVAQALKAGQAEALRAALAPGAPDAAEEAAALERALAAPRSGAPKPARKPGPNPAPRPVAPGITLSVSRGRGGRVLTLSGPEVTEALEARLAAFLAGG